MNTLKIFGKKLALSVALSASILAAASPAQARERYYERGGGNDAAIAIGAGVVGLALGAALADRGDRYYYDRDRWGSRRYVTVRGRPGYYYYYNGAPNRYYRDRYYDRYYAPYYRERWGRGDRWGRDWDRGRDWDHGRGWGHDRRWSGRDWDRRNWDRHGGRGWDRRDRGWHRR